MRGGGSLFPTTFMLLTPLLLRAVESSVRCFCDSTSCGAELVCHGEYCLVGFKADDQTSSGLLRQQCVNERVHVACEARTSRWHEACVCAGDFCNTFAHLRQAIDAQQLEERSQAGRSPYHRGSPDDLGWQGGGAAVPPAPIFGSSDDSDYRRHQNPRGGHNQSGSLVILLVIIPLSVGGLAVCLIFLNYHCKMC